MERRPTVLKTLVQQRRLTFETFRQAYEQTAQQLGLGGLSIEARQFDRWLNGEIRTVPYPSACRVLESLFDRPARELFTSADEAIWTASEMTLREATEANSVNQLPSGDAPAGHRRVSRHVQDDVTTGPGASLATGDVEREVVMAAAHESSEHAGMVESSAPSSTVLEQLHDDVTRLARSYVYTEPLPLMGEMVRVRNRVFRLLDRTQHPRQQKDLLLLAGELCGLLASASFDLGYPDAATAQTRAAWTYGQVIGHSALRAWAKGMQATIAFWHGRPRQAVDVIEQGMAYAPNGTARVQLWCISARAWANLDNATEVSQAFRHAVHEDEASNSVSELHDGIGGQFGFPPARQAFCIGSAYLQARDIEEAIHACQRSVALYEASAPEERSYKAELGARADLTAAYLLRHDLYGAEETLRPVFALAPQQRVTGLVKRLGRVRRLLTDAPYHGAKQAQDLGARIDAFASETVTRALPASPGSC